MQLDRIAELLKSFLAMPQPPRALRELRNSSTGAFSPDFHHAEAASASQESAVLSADQLQSISTYIDLLRRWNARINLTSVREPEEIVTRHFGESLFAARHLFPGAGQVGPDSMPATREAKRLGTAGLSSAASTAPSHVIDVGSGAGFPGLPIKIWAPRIRLTLIESNQKKGTFLREVIRALSLAGVDVFAGRADQYENRDDQYENRDEALDRTAVPETSGAADVVTLRAVERFDSILPVAAGLLGPGGRLAILVGEAQVKRVGSLVPDLTLAEPVKLPLSSNRVLIMGVKNQSG